MGLRIVHNMEAMNAQRNLTNVSNSLSKSMEKLSSGLRINRAADDAAGLAISESLRSQYKGMNQAIRNAQDGVSLIQTTEGSLNETTSILQRMRELAVQASNGIYNTTNLGSIDKEFQQLIDEVDRIAQATKFNGQATLTAATNFNFQVGANNSTVDQIGITMANMQAAAMSIDSLNVAATTTAQAALTAIDAAITMVSNFRADLGAVQNRLEHTIANLGVASENLTASESRIRDVDMAAEMMEFTKTQILQQSGTAILAQANASSQSVLQLLR